ncbi:cytochrome P450 [Xylaria cf. heliscus]|nr:cytochrome P450 [Xylaria cf. heliscus]
MSATLDVTLELLRSNHLYSWGALGLVTILLVIGSNLRDPLSNVPGPWYARWTGLVANYHWVAGRKPSYVHDLHLKYGPIVRVGPREVYVRDLQAVQKIFRIKNEFPKSQWYLDFVPFVQSVFNTPDIAMHRRFRRLLSSPLSESGLKAFLPQIEYKVNLTMQRMEEESKTRGVADIFKWWLFMTTDVIGELSFGESFRMLESGKMNQYVADLQTAGAMSSYRSAFPGLMRFSVRFGIPLPFIGKAKAFNMRVKNYATASLQRHRDLVEKEGPDARPTVFSKVYKAQGDENITPDEVRNNAQAYIIAGSDTTSNTLDYLVWSVCREPEIKSRLLKNLELLPDGFTYDDLRHVPYLDYVIDETLRRYSAVPAGLPREVPEGGAELCGYHIPAGYTVAAQNYSLHRDPTAFPDPEKFDPSRWENPTQAMKDAFMPFGAGSRICIGLHLARMELRLGVARFFKAFPNARLSTREGMSEEEMAPKLFFLSSPQGHRCLMELH